MPSTYIKKNDVPQSTGQSRSVPDNKRPTSSNGYALSTQQLHQLLSGDQKITCHDPFEQAVLKQQQLLVICNLLDRQNSIHQRLSQLLNADDGAQWLDRKISKFKSHCPAEILHKISHASSEQCAEIKYCSVINQNFFSQISEHLYTPLIILSKLQTSELNDNERQDWYEWCLGFKNKLTTIEKQMSDGKAFFSLKTFDKIRVLAKDKVIQQQIGSMKNLFQTNPLPDHDVEFS